MEKCIECGEELSLCDDITPDGENIEFLYCKKCGYISNTVIS